MTTKKHQNLPKFLKQKADGLEVFFVDKNEDHPVSRGMSSVWDMFFAQSFLCWFAEEEKRDLFPLSQTFLSWEIREISQPRNDFKWWKKNKAATNSTTLPFFEAPKDSGEWNDKIHPTSFTKLYFFQKVRSQVGENQ